jgi:hypothetical protein
MIVLDTETTGRGDAAQVIELGWARITDPEHPEWDECGSFLVVPPSPSILRPLRPTVCARLTSPTRRPLRNTANS